jgi:hypothetical protein
LVNTLRALKPFRNTAPELLRKTIADLANSNVPEREACIMLQRYFLF